jgi:hypothetical protein
VHAAYPDAPAAPVDGRDDLLHYLVRVVAAGVPVLVIDPPQYVDPCGTCPDDVDRYGPLADAVAVVETTTGRRARTPVCAEHLDTEVAWAVRYRLGPQVLVPNGDRR